MIEIQNPSSTEKNWNPANGTLNPCHGIQNPRLSSLDSLYTWETRKLRILAENNFFQFYGEKWICGTCICLLTKRHWMTTTLFKRVNVLLKLINNSLRKYKGNSCLMSVWKSDETLLSICILNFSFKNDFVWEEISNIRHNVSSPDETPRSSSKIPRCASYFQLSSRCFIWWWNTASHVWYIT